MTTRCCSSWATALELFQYFFGQLAVGDVMGLLFVLGVVLLLRGKDLPQQKADSRRLAILLLLPFAVAAVAALAHVYPYGGTRHIAFLIIPGVAGVSMALARLAEERWERGLAAAALIVVVLYCIRQDSAAQHGSGRSKPNAHDGCDRFPK